MLTLAYPSKGLRESFAFNHIFKGLFENPSMRRDREHVNCVASNLLSQIKEQESSALIKKDIELQ